MVVGIFPCNTGCIFRSHILNALLSLEVKLHPKTFIARVDEAVGMTPETVHKGDTLWAYRDPKTG